MRLALVNIWPFPAQTPHFGLISLVAYVREELPEINIKIIEGLDPGEEIVRFNPDVVGFTSDTLVYSKTVEKAKQLKKKLKVPFIIGGVHITALPESFDSVFDLGVVGEGEITLVEVLKIFESCGSFSPENLGKITGLIFFDREKLVQTGRRGLIKDVDGLPYPARYLVPMEDYYLRDQLNLFGVRRLATIMTSRGCPYRCVFCGSPVQWGRVRFHSPERVVEEIKLLLSEYAVDGIEFWDDLFIMPKPRVEKMAQLIKKEGLDKKITFFGYARANLIDEDICRILSSINVKRLIFGLESGSERILGYLKQHSVTVADNRRAVQLCRKYGITTSSGFITGTPGETVEDLRKTYKFMKKHPLDNTQIYILTPYPGTKTWQVAEEKGLVSTDMDFSKLFVQLPLPKPMDFFRSSNPALIEDRIFLNTEYRNNQEYLRLIFKMQKQAFLQNLWFYLRVIPRDFGLVARMVKLKTKSILEGVGF